MDRSEWEKNLTCFQACARGFLVRCEVRSARQDFEDIVKEIDGDLTRLEWKKMTIPTPHFTDTDGPLTQPCRPLNPGLSTCTGTSPLRQSSSTPEEEAHQDPSERIEAERDGSQGEGQLSANKDCFLSSSIRKEVPDGELMSTGDSTTEWSSVELDMNRDNPCKGTQQYRSVQEAPRTPDALRLHRNTLTMELLWLQQAIDSRKKYLSLKHRLSIS